MVKIGRNAPRPCGSGLKYKKCCLGKEQTESFTRFLIHRKMDELISQMLEYGEQNFEQDAIRQAWEDFYGSDPESELEGSPYSDMFMRWFLFLWIPNEEEYEDEEYPSPYTIGAQYLKDKKSQLDSPSKKILESALNAPLSYWQVETVRQSKGIFLKDLLLGRECFVEEVEGTK